MIDAQNQLDQRGDTPFDLLVIGGGIVGAGVARDAAMRGLSVALVEQHDFAFGTSSRSTRLLHGGLRYLAQGRLKLVRESSREKAILHRLAPHLYQPLAFVFPSYRGGWPKWKLRVGVGLYDWLGGDKSLGRSRALTKQQALDAVPGMRAEGLRGAVRYFDGFTNDARLVIDTLRSAAHHGATLVNYVRLEDAKQAGKVWACRLHDVQRERAIEMQARSVVNATGPWSDRIPHSGTRLRLTKGVHLVVDRERLAAEDAVVMTQGNRILFTIPWGRRVILGTTDTDYDGPVDTPSCDIEDVQCVLNVVNERFPAAALTPANVISTWTGLRPLVFDGRGKPSEASRRHEITMPKPGWLDVTGGKLTTYRLIAQQTVDRVAGFLNRDIRPCQTALEPLLAAQKTSDNISVIPPNVNETVVLRACHEEWAVHLDDVMIRRTSWRYYFKEHREIAQRVAGWMAAARCWDEHRLRAEMARYDKSAPDSPVM